MRVFLSSRVPRLTILGATMQEIEERPAPEAGCNISSFNRKSFSSQLKSKKGDEFLLNAIEGRNRYKNCTLATAFLKIKDWAHACGVGYQPDGVTPWDCVPSIDRASLRWDHLNKVFKEPTNRHPNWEEGMVWHCSHGYWEHPPNAIVTETEALVSSLDTAVWKSIDQCHGVTEAASAQNLSKSDEIEVKWKDGTSTLEPEKSLKEDDPHTLASCLKRSGLSSRSKRCQWANSVVYIEESTGGVRGGDSANLSSDNEEAGDATKREAPQTDPGECSDAKFFAVRSFGTSCTLSSGAIFLSHQDAVEHAAGNHMTQPGNNVKGLDNIDGALSFASSPVVEKRELCRVTNRNSKGESGALFSLHLKHLYSHLLSLIVKQHSATASP